MGSEAKALELFHRGWEWPKLCPYHPSPNVTNRKGPERTLALRRRTSRPLTDPRQIDGISKRRNAGTLLSFFGTPPLRCSVRLGPMGPKRFRPSVFPGWGREALIGLAKTACLSLRHNCARKCAISDTERVRNSLSSFAPSAYSRPCLRQFGESRLPEHRYPIQDRY